MTIIYLDLETIGTDDESVVSVKPPGNLKKAESIAKWEADPYFIFLRVGSDECTLVVAAIDVAKDVLTNQTVSNRVHTVASV